MTRALLLSFGLLTMVACKDEGGDGDTGASADDLSFEDIGSFTTGDTGFLTDEISITVPEGASSILVHCGEFGDDKLGLLWTLKNPDGSYLYDGNSDSNPSFKSASQDDLVPFLIPLTPDSPLQPGTYTAEVYVDGGSPVTMDCGSVIRTGAAGSSASLKMQMIIVSANGLDAASAPDDANVQAFVAKMESIYSSAGVSLNVQWSDFGGDVATYQVVDITSSDYGEFNDLLRTTSFADPKTIPVFLVEEISSDGSTIVGKSGGPPGAATVEGSSKSGVVVSTVDLADDPEFVATITAHEAGHFLGLFHTTEADSSADEHDVISDTPECPGSADANSNGKLNSDECGGNGAENVMWWTYNAGNASPEFSSKQAQIVRGNPVAR